MVKKHLSALAKFRSWLKPDDHLRKYGPILLLALVPFVFIAVYCTNRFVACDLYPDTTVLGNGNVRYRCVEPAWEISCSQVIKNDFTDVCLKRFTTGITLIHHQRYLRDLECREKHGVNSFASGSAGCGCVGHKDEGGYCWSYDGYCRSQYGTGAKIDVVFNPSDAIEVLLSREEIHAGCLCQSGLTFDRSTSRCR